MKREIAVAEPEAEEVEGEAKKPKAKESDDGDLAGESTPAGAPA